MNAPLKRPAERRLMVWKTFSENQSHGKPDVTRWGVSRFGVAIIVGLFATAWWVILRGVA